MTRQYSNTIALTYNSRGIYCLDPIMGCASGMNENQNGCYGDCYAANASRRYGYDFSKNVLRHFKSEKHRRAIVVAINKTNMPFVRMGNSGDPSEDWAHTLRIVHAIRNCNKQIVIITRHWRPLSDEQLVEISAYNVCINTSVSAMDSKSIMDNCLREFERVKPFCKSILRVVTCDFNLNNEQGAARNRSQESLLQNVGVLETVFRPSKTNPLVLSGIINAKKIKFMGGEVLGSKRKPSIYTGRCGTCNEMCGSRMGSGPERKILTQTSMFKY